MPIEEWMLAAAQSPWVYVATALLIVLDAFLVIVPSETVLVALGSLALSTGSPNVWILVPIAAVSAMVGDNLCFAIGRRMGVERFRWMRRPRVARAIERARRSIHRRPASLILTARYVPFARIAVNLTAGATALPYRTYFPLTVIAGLGWSVFNVVVGATFGSLFSSQPLVGVGLAIVAAVLIGLTIDVVVQRVQRRRGAGA